jgi:DNA-binding transcriptional regulator GbsR (MarR family)
MSERNLIDVAIVTPCGSTGVKRRTFVVPEEWWEEFAEDIIEAAIESCKKWSAIKEDDY